MRSSVSVACSAGTFRLSPFERSSAENVTSDREDILWSILTTEKASRNAGDKIFAAPVRALWGGYFCFVCGPH